MINVSPGDPSLSDVRMKKETDSPLLYIGLKQEVTIIYAGN